MSRVFRVALLFLLASLAILLVATGCRTHAPRTDATRLSKVPPPPVVPSEDDALLRRRAEAHAHYGAGVVHEFSDQTREALEEFYRAAKADPGNEELLEDVSSRLVDGREFERARELLEPVALRDDSSGVLAVRLGFVYSQLGQTTNAIAANQIAVRKLPRSLQATQNLYVNLLQNRQPDAALKVLDDAAAIRDSSGEFLLALAELFASHERQFPAQRESLRAKQLDILHRAAKTGPLLPSLQMKLGDGLNLLGDKDGARRAFLDLVKMTDAPPQLLMLARTKLADALLRANDPDGAAEQLKAITRDDPSNATAHFFLGQIALEKQQWALAADHLKQALAHNPRLEQAYYDLARAQISGGDTVGAFATLDLARGKYSSNFLIEFLTATAYSSRRNYAEAVRHFTRAEIVAAATDDKRLTSGFFFSFGAALERSGNHADAEKYFEKCLALAPEDAEAMNYLGYMWAEQGVKLDRARELIERALKLEPDNEAFLDSMGWVLFKQNQPAAALEFLLKAVAKSEKPDATIFDHLGDVHAALRQLEQAREAWTKSLALETNDVVRMKLEGAATPKTK